MAHGRVFAYCHDSVGIGHLARTLSICDRVGRTYPFSSFLVATGTPYVPLFQNLQRVDYIKLPALAKSSQRTYQGKYLPLSPSHLFAYRKSVLQDTVKHFDPEIVLVDKAPIGVCGELLPALRWLRQHRPSTRVVFGMRDIEDESEATIQQWNESGIPEALEECFDEIWVYGERDVFDVVEEYRLSPAIRDKLTFMGYVTRGACDHVRRQVESRPTVLVTVGGGTDGEFLLTSYLAKAAASLGEDGVQSVIVGGPDLPQAVGAELRRRAESLPGVVWLDFEACMYCRIRASDLVVSMGGYNTLCQIVSNRKPALIIPRTKPRLEQAIRAKLWADRGLLDTMYPDEVTPAGLGNRLREVLSRAQVNPNSTLDFGGLGRVCERFGQFWNSEVPVAAALRL